MLHNTLKVMNYFHTCFYKQAKLVQKYKKLLLKDTERYLIISFTKLKIIHNTEVEFSSFVRSTIIYEKTLL